MSVSIKEKLRKTLSSSSLQYTVLIPSGEGDARKVASIIAESLRKAGLRVLFADRLDAKNMAKLEPYVRFDKVGEQIKIDVTIGHVAYIIAYDVGVWVVVAGL